MPLTQKEKHSIATILKLDRISLKDLEAIYADNNTLVHNEWEISEIININRYVIYLQKEKGEDFRIKDIDVSLFENFKFSPTYTQLQYVQRDITRTPPSSLTSSHSPNL